MRAIPHIGNAGFLKLIRRANTVGINVAVAEVDTQDAWQLATLGIVCVSEDPRHSNEMLSKVIDFIAAERLDAELGAVDMELIAV